MFSPPRPPSTSSRGAILALVLALAGCDSPNAAPAPAPKASQGAPAGASASPSSAAPSTSAQPPTVAEPKSYPIGANGAAVARPANGVFEAGEADAIAKRGDPRRVIVLDKGAEPREALAYRLAPGTKRTTKLALDLAMAMGPPGAEPRLMRMPQTETELEITTERAGEDGSATVRATVVAVRLAATDPSQAAAVSSSQGTLEKLQGIDLTMTIDSHGSRTDVSFGEGAKPSAEVAKVIEQLRQTLTNVLTPLPEEAVGAGARWLVVERVGAPSDVIQLRTVTLKKREGSRAELSVSVDQIAASPRLGPAAVAAAGSPTIASLETSGLSSFAIDFGHVCPDKGESEVKTIMLLKSGKDSARTEAVAKATIESR